MKIERGEKSKPKGGPLSSFDGGACVRLVSGGALYIVTLINGRTAVNLLNGDYRTQGLFVLEPNAKVVIE
jgi:hypothetical protein